MQEVFTKLRDLQKVLLEKYRLEREIEELPSLLATKKELLERLKSSRLEKQKQQEEISVTTEEKQKALAEIASEQEKLEASMGTVVSQREYEAIDKEISAIAAKESELRSEIEHSRTLLDEVSEAVKREGQMIQLQEQEVESDAASIKKTMKTKKELLEDLNRQESEISQGLDEGLLFKLERIIRNKRGHGIVPVVDSVCTGCHMILPRQFVNEIRMETDVRFCPYCSRLLFYQDQQSSEESPADQVAVGTLADLV